MRDLFLTLEGDWDLRNSDVNKMVQTSHSEFYGDLYASHFSNAKNCSLTISASNLMNDSMSFTYASDRITTTREFLANKFNFFFPSGTSSSSCSTSSGSTCLSSTVYGSVITLDAADGSCSLLIIGPLPGQRVIEKYNLQAEGMQLSVRYFISSIEVCAPPTN